MRGKYFFYAILSSALLVLAFPKFSLNWVVWVALVPLLILIYELPPLKSFAFGYLAGFIFFGGLVYWLLVLTKSFGAFGFLAWFLLSILEALSFGFFALGGSIFAKHSGRWQRLFLIPALWVSLEFLRSVGFWGFPWGVLGYSQQPNAVILQTTKLVGVFGLSYLILLINLVTVEIFLSWKKSTAFSFNSEEKDFLLRIIFITALVLSLTIGFGCYSLIYPKPHLASIKVAVVQPNIPQTEKWSSEKVKNIKELHYELTVDALKAKPYLIVWPETAVPVFLLKSNSYLEKLKELCFKNKVYLLIGSFHEERGNLHNSAFLLSPEGKIVKRYDKLYPVPFGEYIPLKPIFGWVGETLGFGEDVLRGKEPTIFSTNKGKFSVSICFESTNSILINRFTANGAQMLVAITNDAWFEKTAAARQHLEMTAVQAAQNGFWAVQSANTGISALIDSNGRVLKETELDSKGVLVGEVSFVKPRTLYASPGEVFPLICLVVSAVGLLLICVSKVKGNG